MEGGIQRALDDLEHLLRHRLDAAADAVAVQRLKGHGLEDEQVQGSLEQVGF